MDCAWNNNDYMHIGKCKHGQHYFAQTLSKPFQFLVSI